MVTPEHIVPEWYFLRAPSSAYYSYWFNRPIWFSLIIIKAINLSEFSNGSLDQKVRGVQHVDKGKHWTIQQVLWSLSSYFKYVFFKFDRWEIVASCKCWNTTYILALWRAGRNLYKREAKTPTANSGSDLNAKSKKEDFFRLKERFSFKGGVIRWNLGIPKRSNSHGIGVSVLMKQKKKISSVSEGRHLRSFNQENFATKSGLVLLNELATGKLNPSNNKLYLIVSDIAVLQAAYYKIKSKPASMTPGVDGNNLNDINISKNYFEKLSESLKNETFQPKPTKRVLIPKKNGKKRPLEIPTLQDRIVQQSLLFVLEAIFEKSFNEKSHGYRPNKGVHTVCKSIKTWRGVSWFVEGDIKGYFDNIGHRILMELVSKKVKDQQLIDLLWKFLRAGVLEDGKFLKTKVGVPQGGIISPILSNIYLTPLDNFIDHLKKELDTKVTSKPNPEYIKAKSLLKSKKGEIKAKGYQELRTIKSTIRIGLRIYYVRYADDWLIGVWGNKLNSQQIKNRIQLFLKQELNLELSEEKTKITHAGKDKAYFLGYEIFSPTPKQSFFAKEKIKKRASHVSIYILAPYEKIKQDLIEKKILEIKNNKWYFNAITKWVNYNHAEILFRYNWIIRGYLNYYSHVDNFFIFHKIINFALRHSCAITLGRKFRLRSQKKVFKKFGKNLKIPNSTIALAIPDNYKKKPEIKK